MVKFLCEALSYTRESSPAFTFESIPGQSISMAQWIIWSKNLRHSCLSFGQDMTQAWAPALMSLVLLSQQTNLTVLYAECGVPREEYTNTEFNKCWRAHIILNVAYKPSRNQLGPGANELLCFRIISQQNNILPNPFRIFCISIDIDIHLSRRNWDSLSDF